MNPKLYFTYPHKNGGLPFPELQIFAHITILYFVNIRYQYILPCKNVIHILPIINVSEFLSSCTFATRTTPPYPDR